MNAAHAQIGDWLGIQPPPTDRDLLRILEGRLSVSIIKRLAVHGLEPFEIHNVVIPSRTLQRRRIRREKLTVEESDRVLSVIRALSFAETIFGSRGRALAWMRITHASLEGRTPLSLLKTDVGSHVVDELLIQIDEGIYT